MIPAFSPRWPEIERLNELKAEKRIGYEVEEQREKCADDGEGFACDWIADAYGELGLILECAALNKGGHSEIGRFVESRLEYFLHQAAEHVVDKKG